MPTVPQDIESFMRFLPDDYNVNQLTLPGTHDSHSIDQNFDGVIGKAWTTTQFEWIKRQLEIGVRYLDLRVGHPNFSMYHGRNKLKDTLSDVLRWVSEWLNQNPTETVLVAVKWDQDGAGEPQDLSDAVMNAWKPKSEGGYGWYYGNEWPKLGEVRGKAILLRRYGSKAGIDMTGFYGEEHHTQPPGKWDQQDDGKSSNMAMEEVWRRAWNHLDWSRDRPFNDNVMHFTGLAQNGLDNPHHYANWVNPALMRHLHDGGNIIDPKNHRYGVIVMDFLRVPHALTIISKNWEQNVFEPDGNRNWRSSDTTPVAQFKLANGDTVSIKFHMDCNLCVWRNENLMWSSGKHSEIKSDNHHLKFQDDGNLVMWQNDNGNYSPVWGTSTWQKKSRLRFMSGPPYITIDTEVDMGQILWTTCPQ